MKKVLSFVLVACAVAFMGCSQAQPDIDNFARNLTAAECANQQATLSNLPLTFVTPAQAAVILAGACDAVFGTIAAPVTAPGNQPVFPAAAPSVSASPVASPSAAASPSISH
jgi:hypothetical protein